MGWYDGSWLESGVNEVSSWLGGGGSSPEAPEVLSVGRVPINNTTDPEASGSWLDRNKGWLKPVAQLGLSAFGQSNKDTSQSAYLDYLRQREDENYADYLARLNAANAAAASGGGGGGSAGAAAAAAAAKATEANRRKAAKRAQKFTQKMYKQLEGIYAPYRQTADRLLPQKEQIYGRSLGIQNLLGDYITRPEQMAKLDAPGPAWLINIPLPDNVKGAKK